MSAYCAENAIYWLWLQRKLGIPSRVIPSVLSLGMDGAKRVYESTPDELWRMGLFSVKTINDLNDRDLAMDELTLKRCAELNISVTCPEDDNYPKTLLSIPDPPAVLFYKGELREASRRPCVAIVGTRKATDYGKAIAHELAERLSRSGVTVVSGVAKGIDTEAHSGALENEARRTIAVLGCGIDYRYNLSNEILRQRLANRGVLLSEYPPGTPPYPGHFPVRNRIISGLSLGTVVIEAEIRSGSLITARLAAEQNRDVFVVPTGVGMPNSSGIHRLLEEGAKPVRAPIDVLREYYAMYPGVLNISGAERPLLFGSEPRPTERVVIPDEKPSEAEKVMQTITEPDTAEPPDFVSEGAKRMYSYLRRVPQLADNLAEQAGVTAQDAMAQLSELELCGCAQAHPGGRYSLA